MAPRRQRLAQRRKAVGFTQEVFAEQLDVERSTVVRWEAGDTEPSPWRRPKIGGDRQLNAHILGSMSHLTHHCGQPQKAMQLARRGHKALHGGPPQPQLQARLLTMHARGSAALGHREDCTRMLIQAEKTLDAAPAEQPSPWVSHFDEASLASETARCMRHLGDLSQAQRQAERIIELRPDTGTRSRAFGQLLLVTVLIAQGKPEQACAIAHDVLTATQSLGSYQVIHQLVKLNQLLERHRANTVVADFLTCLQQTLRERAWIYQWLTKNQRGHSAGLVEGP